MWRLSLEAHFLGRGVDPLGFQLTDTGVAKCTFPDDFSQCCENKAVVPRASQRSIWDPRPISSVDSLLIFSISTISILALRYSNMAIWSARPYFNLTTCSLTYFTSVICLFARDNLTNIIELNFFFERVISKK